MDYASATPVLPGVRKVMEKYWSDEFYNPSAIYAEGEKVRSEIGSFRARIAKRVGVSPKGIVFTSGGTEADNLAIFGTLESFKENQKSQSKPHIVVSAIEHPAVMAAAEEVVRRGGEMSVLPVNEHGLVSLEELKKVLSKNTFLVSVGLANGEIGTVQPIARIGRAVREFRKANGTPYPYLHTDASQAPSYIDIDMENLQADMLSLDAAKIYGPKGIGALVVRKGVEMLPMMRGGAQEGGRRAGTPSAALIAGFAEALDIASRDMAGEAKRLATFKKYFSEYVSRRLKNAVINGSPENCLPNIVSVSVPGIIAEFVLLKLEKEGVLVSVGSACSYDERESGSPVIRAIGKLDLAESTLRFSFGRETTPDDIKRASEIFCRVASNVVK